jgi:hypothetical protein
MGRRTSAMGDTGVSDMHDKKMHQGVREVLHPYRVDGVHDLAVGSTIGTLLNLAVIHFQQVVEPGEELVLAHKECGIHHSNVRHGCCVGPLFS